MKVETIYGPPGTGKTTTLVGITETELAANNRVTYLSYSKAAATEATSRIASKDNLRVSTIHSLAFQALGMDRQQVVGKMELKNFGRMIGIPFSGAEANTDEEQQEGDEYMAVVQYARNTMITNDQAYDMKGSPGQRDRFAMFAASYTEWKTKNGLMDFDDMIDLAPARGLPRLPVIILDEAQDCSPLQWRLIRALTKVGTQRMYVAGDDDQAIFEWNGADPHGMVKFTEDHKGSVRVLDQSYRVPLNVYMEACKLTDRIKTRVPKDFRHRDAQGQFERFDSVEDTQPDFADFEGEDDVMYLARDRFQLNEIKLYLNHNNIPYSINGGQSNWTNKYAKAIRALNAAKRGEEYAMTDIKPLLKRDGKQWHPSDPYHKIIDVPPWLRQFYNAVDLDQPINTRISTIHQAKGQEAKTVIVDLKMSTRGLNEIYAGDRARDAEYRVWYVAYTRAKENLLICGENPLV